MSLAKPVRRALADRRKAQVEARRESVRVRIDKLRSEPKGRKKKPGKKRKADKKQCDVLWSKLVKVPQVCRYAQHNPEHKCAGPFQAAHGFSRRYLGTRWDLRNGFCLCAGAHYKFTLDPLGWDELLRDWWGEREGLFYGKTLYQELRENALKVSKPDYEKILSVLNSGGSCYGGGVCYAS